jgi:hypothetical protein
LVVIAAIVCVLVFVVFGGDGGSGATTGPEKAVAKLLDAMENQDIEGVFNVLDPEAMSEMLGGELGDEFLDMAKDAMGEQLFSEGSIKFSGIKMQTEETGDGTATVAITEGLVTMTDVDGNEETEDVRDAGEPVVFQLVERDGTWYVDPSSMDW